jgi:hypothetical protein
MTDIRLVFTTDAQLSDACAKLEQFKETGRLPEGVSDEEMWRARQVKEATIHPVTNEKMFLPGRMCCFVPSNLPSTVGMLMAQTPSGMLFWHWFNQSVNVMVNYTNRSGADVNISQLSQAYGLAVVSSCSVAIGASTCVHCSSFFHALAGTGTASVTMSAPDAGIAAAPVAFCRLVKRGPSFIKKLGFAVPYTAVVTAGAGNVIFTRWPEVETGVPIRDLDGNVLGSSSLAAKESIKLTVLSRNAFLPMTPMLVPPLVMGALRSAMPIVAAGGAVAVGTEVRAPYSSALFHGGCAIPAQVKRYPARVLQVVVVAACIAIGLPLAIAVFPQETQISTAKLEEGAHVSYPFFLLASTQS